MSAVISSSSSSPSSLEEGSSQTCVGAVPRDLSLYDIMSGIRRRRRRGSGDENHHFDFLRAKQSNGIASIQVSPVVRSQKIEKINSGNNNKSNDNKGNQH